MSGHNPLEHLPPWLWLLSPLEKGWREDQLLKGRDPDTHIEAELIKAGKWSPEKGSGSV